MGSARVAAPARADREREPDARGLRQSREGMGAGRMGGGAQGLTARAYRQCRPAGHGVW
jgi:hypothetical protein